MIENCIITPTYKGHFPFIKKYLKTYVHFVEDAHEVPVFFIISRNESNEFKKLISPFIKKSEVKIVASTDYIQNYFTHPYIRQVYCCHGNLFVKGDRI